MAYVFRPKKVAIFVHGCFWHGHGSRSCRIAHMPKTNTEFWQTKIARNQAR
ncbi:MAG TPA: very short patch repair endonuclease, partial [Herbaspirillum sp.]|nr:very short patch repair endonuclease [Herbaspirillum sp.]